MAAADRCSLLIESLSDYCGSWRNFFAGIGLLTSGYLTLRSLWAVARAVNIHFLGARNVRYRLTQYGQWAVVTGCTRGIGREFALLLASYGLDVILIARDEVRLNELAVSIQTHFGVQTVCICADFSKGRIIYDAIKEAIAEKEIGILINNVGVMYDYPDYFVNINEDKLWELIQTNMAAAQAMTHAVSTSCMIRRRRGLIVFVSSICAYQPTPFMTAYAATKAYENFLARGLYFECRKFNIQVQTLMPAYVATEMTAYSQLIGQANILSPSAADYVRHASWTLGRTDQTTGYFIHTMVFWGAQILPEWCWIRIGTMVTNFFRRAALAKAKEKRGLVEMGTDA